MPWSFPGISYPAQMLYTQHAGFDADKVQIRALPQVTNFPTSGTLTMVWGATVITLPNCVVDAGTFRLTADGKFLDVILLDRRDHWTRTATISADYNLMFGGTRVAATQKNLRQIAQILFTAMGEASANVSVLPTDVYPRVTMEQEQPVVHLRKLLEDRGYTVVLGFGNEPVKVVRLGQGASLPTTDAFLRTDGLDPKVAPRYVRTVFKKTVLQCRMALEAVGLDTDGVWKPIDSLSYAPAGGWGSVKPYTMQDSDNVGARPDEVGFVRRAYRIKGFVNDTAQPASWLLPYFGTNVPGLDYILPLEYQLVEKQTIRDWDNRGFPRVYGRYMKKPWAEDAFTDLEADDVAEITEQVSDFFRVEHDYGMILFSQPMFLVTSIDYYEPADLYLEAAFTVRDPTTFAKYQKTIDVDVYPQGSGYINMPGDDRLEVITTYSGNHAISGSTTNTASLQIMADANAAAASGLYNTDATQQIVYSQPQLNLRCDGAILQVQHVLTCGEFQHHLNRTIASRNWEFDRGIPTRRERRVAAQPKLAETYIPSARVPIDG